MLGLEKAKAGVLAAILAAALAAFGAEEPVKPAEDQRAELRREWRALLELASRHDREARERILAVAKESREPLRQLAEVLIEEWEIDRTDPEKARPRQIAGSQPNVFSLSNEDRKVKVPMAALEGSITVDGQLARAQLNRSTGNPKIDRLFLETAAQWLFRPAYGPKTGFQESRYTMSMNICLR